jgi:hypothetical protein
VRMRAPLLNGEWLYAERKIANCWTDRKSTSRCSDGATSSRRAVVLAEIRVRLNELPAGHVGQ